MIRRSPNFLRRGISLIEPVCALAIVAVVAVTLPGAIRAYVHHIEQRQRVFSSREPIYLIPPGGAWERKLGVPTALASAPRTTLPPASLFVDFHPDDFVLPGSSQLYLIDCGREFSAQTRGCMYGWEEDCSDQFRLVESGDSVDGRLIGGFVTRTAGVCRWKAVLAPGSYDLRIVAQAPSKNDLELLAVANGSLVAAWAPSTDNVHFVGLARTESADGMIAIEWSATPTACVKYVEIERARTNVLTIVASSQQELQVVATPANATAAP